MFSILNKSARVMLHGNQRRGAVAVQVAISLVALIGFSALAIDIGYVYAARSEMQRAADAAALAAAASLLDSDRLRGSSYQDSTFEDARDAAVEYAYQNAVGGLASALNENEDVTLGFFNDWSNLNDLSVVVASQEDGSTNAVQVTLRRNPDRGGSLSLFFAGILGFDSIAMEVKATAAYQPCVDGFQVTDPDSYSDLLPFALQQEYWLDLTDGTITTDNYSYDSSTGTVTSGSDGIAELNLYPGSGSGQLPPGNFGTVDIGNSNNSAADIARQILEGPNADDFAYLGGSLVLGSDGTVVLNGDTGLSAGFKDELEDIIGQPRIIPIFSTVAGPGNNANFTVVGFGGIRIMYVKLTGAMSSKKVIIQPAYAVDSTGVPGESNCAYTKYAYLPPRLIR